MSTAEKEMAKLRNEIERIKKREGKKLLAEQAKAEKKLERQAAQMTQQPALP